MKTRLKTSFLGWRLEAGGCRQRIVVPPVCSLQSPAGVPNRNVSRLGGPSSLRSAFTLVELLVVVAIVALSLAALLPALGSFFDSARAPDARNLISAHLAGARNYAVANNITTALVFVEDDDDDGTSRTLMFLAEEDIPDNPDEFIPVTGRETTHLPDNIMVTNDTTEAIAICFLPAGQLTTLTINPGDVTWPVDAPTSVESATKLDIYDYVVSTEDPEVELYINYYTGAVIEQ